MTQIKAYGAGVSITYDAVNDQFKLTSKSTGSYDVSVEDVSGNLLESMGLNSISTSRSVQTPSKPLIAVVR